MITVTLNIPLKESILEKFIEEHNTLRAKLLRINFARNILVNYRIGNSIASNHRCSGYNPTATLLTNYQSSNRSPVFTNFSNPREIRLPTLNLPANYYWLLGTLPSPEIFSRKNLANELIPDAFITQKETPQTRIIELLESYQSNIKQINHHISGLVAKKQLSREVAEAIYLEILISRNLTLITLEIKVDYCHWISNFITRIEDELANRIHSRLTWKHEYHISVSTYYDN